MDLNEKLRAAKTQLACGEIANFIGRVQKSVMADCLRGEEREWMADTILAIVERIESMPVSYQTDGQGKDAIVHLHYFGGGAINAWITEKDMDGGVEQAYGWVNMYGDMSGAECGYTSIKEMVEAGLDIDLYWTPKPVREC